MCLQDLKYKILVKGKKERVVEGCSSSCSDLSSSDEESIQARAKKEDKKVRTAAAPFGQYSTTQKLNSRDSKTYQTQPFFVSG